MDFQIYSVRNRVLQVFTRDRLPCIQDRFGMQFEANAG